MKKRLRLLLVVCAGLLGLAFAAPALAVYQPDLTVQQSSYKAGAATTAGFVVTIDPSNDPTAKMTIFSPAGYASNLSQTPGTVIGKALAYVQAHKVGDIIVPLAGNVVVADPAGTVEWRTYVGLPSSLTFKRAKSKASQVAFSGALTIAGLNPGGIKLHLYSSTKAQPAPNYTLGTPNGLFGTGKFVSTKGVKSNGKYSIARKKPKGKKKTFYQMRFENYLLVPSTGDNCEGPSPSGLPIPCNGTSLAPLTSANTIAVKPRR